jgi:hypothetical protein
MDRTGDDAGHAEVHTHLGVGPHQHHDDVDGLEELSRESRAASGGRVRGVAARALDRATAGLDERTGLIGVVRDNPLAAVGVAFTIGVLVAGKSDSAGRFGKLKQQLRGAVIGAISAAVAQEARNLAGAGRSSLLAGLFGDEVEERAAPRRTRRS